MESAELWSGADQQMYYLLKFSGQSSIEFRDVLTKLSKWSTGFPKKVTFELQD